MTRETLAALITALQPLLLALITAAAAWGAAAIRRRTKDARVLAAVDVVTRGAEGVVADLSQNLVQDLKDPNKPGSWDQVAKQSARRVAVERVRRLLPGDVATLDATLGRERAEELLGTLIERAVVAQKRGAPLAVGELLTIEPPAPSKVPAPIHREGERGTVRVGVLVSLSGAILVATLAGALLAGCPGPVVPVDGGPAVTPSSWTSTARVVITTLRWALPAARAITDLTVAEPGRTQVARALDAAAQATDRLHGAVDAYEARGGDRCAARAAVGGLQVALVGVAQVLADNGVALGTTLERIVDAVASIADALIPACDADAGWSSAGDSANARLRAIAESARARGVTLRRVLDDLRPMDAGAL